LQNFRDANRLHSRKENNAVNGYEGETGNKLCEYVAKLTKIQLYMKCRLSWLNSALISRLVDRQVHAFFISAWGVRCTLRQLYFPSDHWMWGWVDPEENRKIFYTIGFRPISSGCPTHIQYFLCGSEEQIL